MNNLKNFVFTLCDYIGENYTQQKYNLKAKRIVYLHFLKADKIVHLFILVALVLLNICSFLIFFKKFIILDNKSKNKIFLIFFKFKILKFKKIIELVHALLMISTNFNEKLKKKSINNIKIEKDYNYIENIVIGSGPSGSVTAYNLKKNEFDTLLIEKGNYFSIPKQKHSGYEFLNKWSNSGLQAAIGKIDIQYSSGSCLGGGSEINSGLYHEVDETFVDKLYHNQNIFQKFKRNFPRDLVNFDNFSDSQSLTNLLNYYKFAAKKLNWKIENLPRFKRNQTGQINSMTNTLIEDYKKINGKILTGYEVKKIQINGDKCNLTLKNKNKEINIICKNLFLCCGAPYSLNLLQKSKILSNKINHNFHFHPMFKVVAKFKDKVNESRSLDIISSQITEFYPDYIFGNAASGKQFLKISTLKNFQAYKDVDKNFEFMSIFHSTFSLGKSKLIKIPFINQPLIYYNFYKRETKIIKEGIINLCKFIFTSGAEYIYLLDENCTKIDQNQKNKLEEIIEKIQLSLSSVHLLGGLDMNDKKIFNMDEYGKLKIKNGNIYINDSTLICHDLLKNPQGTIMTMAKTNIENFLIKKGYAQNN